MRKSVVETVEQGNNCPSQNPVFFSEPPPPPPSVSTHPCARWTGYVARSKGAEKHAKASRTAALVRGYLARKRVAKIRQTREEETRVEAKRLPLQRRMDKVSAASRVVASCVIKSAAHRRRQRARDLLAAVGMVRALPANACTCT